jgi:hypothetical protein
MDFVHPVTDSKFEVSDLLLCFVTLLRLVDVDVICSPFRLRYSASISADLQILIPRDLTLAYRLASISRMRSRFLYS